MKLAILVAAIDPSIGGVLVFGDRGTGKSTAVRALAALLPKMRAVVGCRYHCDPDAKPDACEQCAALKAQSTIKTHRVPVPVVDLPLGATEDRVVGALAIWSVRSARASRRSSPGCWRARTAASCTSTRSTCSRTISSICSSMSPRRARTSSNAKA